LLKSQILNFSLIAVHKTDHLITFRRFWLAGKDAGSDQPSPE